MGRPSNRALIEINSLGQRKRPLINSLATAGTLWRPTMPVTCWTRTRDAFFLPSWACQQMNDRRPGNCCSRRASRYRSEEHTSELQSRENLVCRLLLEKKKKHN